MQFSFIVPKSSCCIPWEVYLCFVEQDQIPNGNENAPHIVVYYLEWVWDSALNPTNRHDEELQLRMSGKLKQLHFYGGIYLQ